MCNRLLTWICCIGACLSITPQRGGAAEPIRVALYDDQGVAGKGVPRISEQLGKLSQIKLGILSGKTVAEGGLKGYDVVIFSGGSGSKQANGLGEKGREEVRAFVKNGGGYVGICGGAYLACCGFSWGLEILNAKTVSPKWQRGKAEVRIAINDAGQNVSGLPAAEYDVLYHNGPILQPASHADLPAYETLALFRTEVAEHNTPAGVMVNSPAWVRTTFGKGRVVISSPHPEQQDGMEHFVENVVQWVATKEASAKP